MRFEIGPMQDQKTPEDSRGRRGKRPSGLTSSTLQLLALAALLSGCASRRASRFGPIQPLEGAGRAPAAAASPREGNERRGAPESGPRVEIEPPAYSRDRETAIEYRIEASGPVDRVELWTSADGGRSWSLSGDDPDRRSPVQLSAPDGEYGLWITAQVRGQPPPLPPRPGDPPRAKVVIDTTPPQVEIADVRVSRSPGGRGSLDLRVETRVRDANPDPTQLRLDWKIPSGAWKTVELDPAARGGGGPEPSGRREPSGAEPKLPGAADGAITLSLPEPAEEPIFLRLTATDRAGNSASRVEEVHFLESLDPPRLEFLSFDDGGVYRGGAILEVRFLVSWLRLAPGGLSLTSSSDGGRTWQPLGSGIDPALPFRWTLPAVDTREMVLELAARGTCGFRAARRSRPFKVDSQPPVARILGPRFSSRQAVRLSVQARDAGPAGLDRLVLYAAPAEGGEPRKVGEFPPGDGIDYQADRVGEIGLWLVGIDKAGNSGPLPGQGETAPFLLEVDPKQPLLSLESFAAGGVYRGGSRLYVFLKGDPALLDRPMSIHLSEGPDGPFRPVAEGLTFHDRYLWRLPEATGEGFRLKVEVQDRSGETVRTVSPQPFAIDSTPPRSAVESAELLPSGKARIRYEASDSPAGVARVRIWDREEGEPGRPWREIAAEEPPKGSGARGAVEVELPPGRHGLRASAEDRVGNAGLAPAGPEEPQARLVVGPAPAAGDLAKGGEIEEPSAAPAAGPGLTLANFHEGVYRGGDRRYIFWKLAGPGVEAALLDIATSVDGGSHWSPLVAGLPAGSGRYGWALPSFPGSARRMRLSLTARAGAQSWSARSSGDFVVDCRAPRLELLGPRASRSAHTRVRYRLLAPEAAGGESLPVEPTPVARIECYLRSSPALPWHLKGQRDLEPGERPLPAGKAAPGPKAPAEAGPDEKERPEAEAEPGEDEEVVEVMAEDGRYEVALVGVDLVGNHTVLPEAGPPDPRRQLLIDTVRPRLKVTVPEKKDIYSGGEAVAVAIQVEDENLPEFPVRIESGGGGEAEGEWRVLERYFPRDRTYSLRLDRVSGPRRLRITAADLAGNTAEEVLSFAVVPPGPRVRLLGFEKPRAVRAGEPLVIRWESSGVEPGTKPVALRTSRDGGQSWLELASELPNQGLYAWTAPQEDVPDLRLRIEVTDPAGQSASAESAAIAVSGRAPRVILWSVEPAVPAPAPSASGKKPTDP